MSTLDQSNALADADGYKDGISVTGQ